MDEQLARAERLYVQGRLGEAETVYREILQRDSTCRRSMERLSIIALQKGEPELAEALLGQLVRLFPDEPLYTDRMAALLTQRGKTEAAIECYTALLSRQPDLVDSRYNFARLLKREGELDDALDQYRHALDLGVERAEEVHVNMSVIYAEQHRDAQSELALEQALKMTPDYVPALYNLALLREEQGRWSMARALLEQVLQLVPQHVDALVRLAHGEKHAAAQDPLPARLERALAGVGADQLAAEHLYFALGKMGDDRESYADAFEFYGRANKLASQRLGGYDRKAQEQLTRTLLETFCDSWIESIQPVSSAAPIFVCGMFRSGSTLLEQMLAAHPALESGGEINFFNQQAPLSAMLSQLNQIPLDKLAGDYLSHLERTFPGDARVINKRPDNVLYLGLIRELFPNARIIHTVRHPLDVCLSAYFAQFTKGLAYTSDLLDCGHYLQQQQLLMQGWRASFDASIKTCEYEKLVAEPRATLEPLLEFLGLEWHANCENFHRHSNRVRTASVTQVRQPLYRQSLQRWQHYSTQLAPLISYFESAGVEL